MAHAIQTLFYNSKAVQVLCQLETAGKTLHSFFMRQQVMQQQKK
jgi:hypothetical protein